MLKILAPIALAAALSVPATVLAQAAPLTFEVASVKPSAPPDPTNPLTMAPMMLPGAGGAVRGTNLPLRLLIRAAYKVEDEQIVGGPPWQLSAKFDITAKPADGAVATEDALRERLKGLLADRFKLKIHTETREMSTSALMLARSDGTLGPNLKPSTADCSNQVEEAQKLGEEIRRNPGNAIAAMAQMKCGIMPVPTPGSPGSPPRLTVRGLGQPIANLASILTQFAGQQVVDKTGLTGPYDFEFELPLDPEILRRIAGQVGVNTPPGAQGPKYDGPALTTILNERLGLKLDSQKAPVEVIVIDSAQMPTAD